MNLIEEIKNSLVYDEETGEIKWKKCSRGRRKDLIAGCVDKNKGYKVIRVGQATDSILLPYHRVIWALKYGLLPEFIDHIDGDRLNNKFTNLRSVTRQENQQNRRLSSNNKSGYHGISWFKRDGTWMVKIGKKFLGYYKDLEDAIEVRKQAEIEKGYHKNHGN